MERRRSLPDWLYYLFAVLVTLPTLPVYYYFFSHRSPGEDVSSSHAIQRVFPAAAVSVPRTFSSSFYAYDAQLPAGYICAGADGVVYRKRVVDGAVSVEPLYRDGQLVRCGGDSQSSHRYR